MLLSSCQSHSNNPDQTDEKHETGQTDTEAPRSVYYFKSSRFYDENYVLTKTNLRTGITTPVCDDPLCEHGYDCRFSNAFSPCLVGTTVYFYRDAGQYRSWSEVGGDNTHIAVLQRNAGSGSQSALLNFMGDTPVKTDYLTFMGRSIGFSFRFYVEGMVGKDSPEGGVKLLALDGVYPSTENIKNGSYPIINELYAVTRKGEENPNVQAFVDWMLTEEGQAIVEGSGYVGIK